LIIVIILQINVDCLQLIRGVEPMVLVVLAHT